MRLRGRARAAFAFTPMVPVFAITPGIAGEPVGAEVVITQPAGESAVRVAETRLPPGFSLNPGFVRPRCAPAQERELACPEETRIGTIDGTSTFGPFTGTIHLTEDWRLHAVVAGLGGLVRVAIEGVVEVRAERVLVVRFDNLPDVQNTRSRIVFEPGNRSPLAAPRACGTAPATVRLVSHDGDERRFEFPVTTTGCTLPPVVLAARIVSARGARPVLRWRAERAAHTEITLSRARGGVWRELGTVRATGGSLALSPRWRGQRLGAGRYRASLVALAADGRRSLARHITLRLTG